MPGLNTDDPTIDVGSAVAPAYAPALVEPKASDIVLCSYPDTMDGTAAAWVIYKIAKRDKIAVTFVNTGTNKLWTPDPKTIIDRHWIAICDSSLPAGTYGKTLLTFFRGPQEVKKPIPYRNWKRVPPYGIDDIALTGKTCGVHDVKVSLCRGVWQFFCADRVGFDKPPRMLSHIDDFVTKSNRYNDSEDICAAISSYPKELGIYDRLAIACEDRRRREAMIAAGQGIRRYIETLKR